MDMELEWDNERKTQTTENTHRKLGVRRWVVWSKVNGCCTHDPMGVCDGMVGWGQSHGEGRSSAAGMVNPTMW